MRPPGNRSALLMAVFNHVPDAKSIDVALTRVDYVVFVDNSTDESISGRLDQLALRGSERCVILRPHENLGISKGYNLALEYVARLGVDWVHFVDHDAVFGEEYFDRLRETWVVLSRASMRIGAVVPIVSDDPILLNRGIGVRRPWFVLSSAITSGILTRTDILQEVGGFDDTLFVEGVDLELTHRMRTHGLEVCCLSQVLIVQDFESPVAGPSLAIALGNMLTRLRSVVRVAIGNANIFRTKLSLYNPGRWVELSHNLEVLRGVDGLRWQAALTDWLNHVEARYITLFCSLKAPKPDDLSRIVVRV
jgi:hypothetical protein